MWEPLKSGSASSGSSGSITLSSGAAMSGTSGSVSVVVGAGDTGVHRQVAVRLLFEVPMPVMTV